MQVAAFQNLYAEYQDTETSLATETLERTVMRLKQQYTYFYYIKVKNSIVGAERVVDTKNQKNVLFNNAE